MRLKKKRARYNHMPLAVAVKHEAIRLAGGDSVTASAALTTALADLCHSTQNDPMLICAELVRQYLLIKQACPQVQS